MRMYWLIQIIFVAAFCLNNFSLYSQITGKKTVEYDTIYYNQQLLSIIEKKDPNKFICKYKSHEIKLGYKSLINNYIDISYPTVIRKHRVDEFLGMPNTEIINSSVFVHKMEVGETQVIYNNEPFLDIMVKITKSGFEEKQLRKMQIDIRNYYRKLLKTRHIHVYLTTDYTEEKKKLLKIKEEQRKKLLEIEEEQRKKLLEIEEKKEMVRINNFYDYVVDALNNPLKEIEGVYRSIDQGEKFNYDIVILKSNSESNVYESYTLKATDTAIKVGDRIFTLFQTSEKDKFIMKYFDKNGKIYENKLAQLDMGILKSGIKSFVKMYPSKNDTRNYSQIDPLVDWDASGSGIILNEKGIIATNYHVIAKARKIRVKLQISDTTSYEFNARIIVKNENDDIAILQIEDSTFHSKDLGFERINIVSTKSIGQEVFTLGFPNPCKLGENVKLNKGIISAIDALNKKCYFQTDLPVWFGNSGGPCYNRNGDLIGLVSSIIFDNKQKIENVCYVVSSECIYETLSNELKMGLTYNINKSQNQLPDFPEIVKSVSPYSVFIKVYISK